MDGICKDIVLKGSELHFATTLSIFHDPYGVPTPTMRTTELAKKLLQELQHHWPRWLALTVVIDSLSVCFSVLIALLYV